MPSCRFETTPAQRWIVYRNEELDDSGALTPVTYDPLFYRKADPHNPETWASFETALAAYATGLFDGIGLVLAPERRKTADWFAPIPRPLKTGDEQ